ncbi:MAG TPA: hypothetical protein VNC84_07655 [Gammaproteobacteria bacterium]|jgi:serine/threonine protein kinase|nr:hypothetical protein [Gammaproteobacteria bacterium]
MLNRRATVTPVVINPTNVAKDKDLFELFNEFIKQQLASRPTGHVLNAARPYPITFNGGIVQVKLTHDLLHWANGSNNRYEVVQLAEDPITKGSEGDLFRSIGTIQVKNQKAIFRSPGAASGPHHRVIKRANQCSNYEEKSTTEYEISQRVPHLRIKGRCIKDDSISLLIMENLMVEDTLSMELFHLVTEKAELSKIEKLILSTLLVRRLDELHRSGIIHGDIKPENIIVSGIGEIEVEGEQEIYMFDSLFIDFGGSVLYDRKNSHFSFTPEFVAPEVALGVIFPLKKYYTNTVSSDLYGLCLTLAVTLFGATLKTIEEGVSPASQILFYMGEYYGENWGEDNLFKNGNFSDFSNHEKKKIAALFVAVCGRTFPEGFDEKNIEIYLDKAIANRPRTAKVFSLFMTLLDNALAEAGIGATAEQIISQADRQYEAMFPSESSLSSDGEDESDVCDVSDLKGKSPALSSVGSRPKVNLPDSSDYSVADLMYSSESHETESVSLPLADLTLSNESHGSYSPMACSPVGCAPVSENTSHLFAPQKPAASKRSHSVDHVAMRDITNR